MGALVANGLIFYTAENTNGKDTQNQVGRALQHCLVALNEVCESSPLHLRTYPVSCSTDLVKKRKFSRKSDISGYIKIFFWSIHIQFLDSLV